MRSASTGSGYETHQVTNTEFAEFVDATGYLTVAERPLNPDDYPGAPPENLQPGSMVFTRTSRAGRPAAHEPVVDLDAGRVLEAPEGAAVVVQGPRAPSRRPCRVRRCAGIRELGRPGTARPRPSGRPRPVAGSTRRRIPGATSPSPPASGWPTTGTANSRICPTPATGRRLRSAAFPPTATGCSTWPAMSGSGPPTGTPRPDRAEPCCAADSYDPAQPQFKIPRKVIKGGSFLCADSYCLRYRPAARRPQMVDTGMSHIGFRCIVR